MKPEISRTAMSAQERSLRAHIAQIVAGAGILHGSLVVRKRICGKPNCHCAEGEPHVATVFADRSEGRQRNYCLHGPDLALFRKMTEAYRKVRANRVRLVKVQREILQLFDALEEDRRLEGERRHGARLPTGVKTGRSSRKS